MPPHHVLVWQNTHYSPNYQPIYFVFTNVDDITIDWLTVLGVYQAVRGFTGK
jgi:hypothetical protein